MEHIQIFKDMRELLSDEDNWVKGRLAVNDKNENVDPIQMDACAWCLNGAMNHAVFYLKLHWTVNHKVRTVLSEFLDSSMFETLTCFNDDPYTTHKDVLSLLDEAIETGEQCL